MSPLLTAEEWKAAVSRRMTTPSVKTGRAPTVPSRHVAAWKEDRAHEQLMDKVGTEVEGELAVGGRAFGTALLS